MIAALVAALAMVADAATNAAAGTVRLNATVAAAPVWVGSQALLLVESEHEYTLRTVDPESATVAASVTVPRHYERARLAASQSLVAVQGTDTECSQGCKYENPYYTADDLLAAAPGATPRCIAQTFGRDCRADAQVCPEVVQAPLVSATTLIYEACTVNREFGEATEEPVSAISTGPGGPIRRLTAIAYPEALAGEWLIGLAPGWKGYGVKGRQPYEAPLLVEQNLLTGAEPLHLELPRPSVPPELYGDGEYPAIASVQEDGQVAWVTGAKDKRRLWTASPIEPTARALGRPAGGAELSELMPRGVSLIMRSGRIAQYDAHDGILVKGLDGVSLGAVHARGLEGFDFDGTRVLLASTPCSESFLTTWTVGEGQPAVPAGRCSAPDITHVSFGTHSVRVALACPSSSVLGCPPASVEVTTFGHSSKFVELLPGARRTVSLALGRYARRFVMRHPRKRVTLTVNSLGRAPPRTVRVRVP
jgi:hypothetical protein